ncbi:MAG: heparinase II/III family protein [Pyrinomonadaceae bacterium]|nr:heparinase II/III family protein [Pyrinomonadaceae bacterium]
MSEEKKSSSFAPATSKLIPRIRRALRGEVDAVTLAREAWRRSRTRLERDRERARLELLDKTQAHLISSFKSMDEGKLLEHFRHRREPRFLPGFNLNEDKSAYDSDNLFREDTKRLIKEAALITDEHSWPLLGFGAKRFGREIEWRRDPVSGYEWPLVFHADISFASRGDGSDVRVLWELNRLGHTLTLARAYALTRDEDFTREFFRQLESWREQNPVGLGANWSCAMEVALRAMNLLGALEIFRHSELMTPTHLRVLLDTLEQHGAHIRRNLEFSYIATSNHYLSDVVGLLWLGVMLPELECARGWQKFGLREMLREMDKQVLEDGADFEASTGYHRLALELFLYSFILCRENQMGIEERYWQRLRQMFEYTLSYLRPDGRAPLIGDTDSGRILPIKHRAADDHAYLLALGAALFKEPRFKMKGEMPEELPWILGHDGVRSFESLPEAEEAEHSRGFAHAGTYVMRERDLYLLFNASGVGARGRGSHGHNDALSLEVSACGVSFIIDPGTFVYTGNLEERNLFRSTRYHSTVEIDCVEQNTTDVNVPFVLGDEAHPRVLEWETGPESDYIKAEHGGYARLGEAVNCTRSVRFDKRERFWLVEDSFEGAGRHDFHFRFHFAPRLEVRVRDEMVEALDAKGGARLFVLPLDATMKPELEQLFASNDYGAKRPSISACWTLRASVPLKARWAIVPLCAEEAEQEKLALIKESLR